MEALTTLAPVEPGAEPFVSIVPLLRDIYQKLRDKSTSVLGRLDAGTEYFSIVLDRCQRRHESQTIAQDIQAFERKFQSYNFATLVVELRSGRHNSDVDRQSGSKV